VRSPFLTFSLFNVPDALFFMLYKISGIWRKIEKECSKCHKTNLQNDEKNGTQTEIGQKSRKKSPPRGGVSWG